MNQKNKKLDCLFDLYLNLQNGRENGKQCEHFNENSSSTDSKNIFKNDNYQVSLRTSAYKLWLKANLA